MFEEITNPKLKEWLMKDENEQEKIAEKNGWRWYFDWFEAGDIIRYKYEQADKDPRVKDKYHGCYDGYYKKHTEKASYTFLGPDARFHHSETPTHTWTEYEPCTNTKCPHYDSDRWEESNCSYFGDNCRIGYDCFNELFAQIQQWIDVVGIEELNELQKKLNIHPDIIGWFKYGNAYFKKGDKVNKNLQKLIDEIKKDIDICYEYDSKECNAETGIKPEGEFAYMLEYMSDLIEPNEERYHAAYGDFNGTYIRDVMKLINKVEKKADELQAKYEEYGVEVTVGDYNNGCEWGMAIYLWIPKQEDEEMKMCEEAVKEISFFLKEVQGIQKLVGEMGITFDSDTWSAINTSNFEFRKNHEYENILTWEQKDFEEIDISEIDSFSLGGCVITSSHEYNGEYVNEPKVLAQAKGETVKRFLKDIVDVFEPEYFKLSLAVPYELYDNDGWEQFICIDAKPIKEKCCI